MHPNTIHCNCIKKMALLLICQILLVLKLVNCFSNVGYIYIHIYFFNFRKGRSSNNDLSKNSSFTFFLFIN